MKKERDLFSIGEVARALNITRRAILYYEEFGLIRPDVKDGATGNRYYTIDTFVKLRTIRICRTWDCPSATSSDILTATSRWRR